jgi:uncharacterized protein (TIGR00297 family)
LLPLVDLVIEFFVVVGVALAAVLLNTIDGRGFLASASVGFAIVFGGGLSWFVLVAVFFVTGVAFTLYEYGYKKRIGGAQEKGGARNWPNILANGAVASGAAVLNLFTPSPMTAALFVGAVSASAADTAATELGLLSPSRPRLITNPFKFVTPGTSGGVSLRGFAGAAMASLIIGTIALFLGILPGLELIYICVAGGVAGAVADRFAGADVQRRGYCPVCLKPTEALRHCGEKTMPTAGVPFVENNVVNLVATSVGALVSLWLLLAISL